MTDMGTYSTESRRPRHVGSAPMADIKGTSGQGSRITSRIIVHQDEARVTALIAVTSGSARPAATPRVSRRLPVVLGRSGVRGRARRVAPAQ